MELSIGNDFLLEISSDDARRLSAEAAQSGYHDRDHLFQPLSENPLTAKIRPRHLRGVEAIAAIQIARHGLRGIAAVPQPPREWRGNCNTAIRRLGTASLAEFRRLIPDAEREKVYLTPENVWNKFLLSPLEMRAFVDQFRSPCCRCTSTRGTSCSSVFLRIDPDAGPRIRRLHLKDYKLGRIAPSRDASWTSGRRRVNWKAVMAALVKTGLPRLCVA